MNSYEKRWVERIISGIKEKEKSKKMSTVEKAYTLYRNLGDIYQYKTNYRYANYNTYEEILKQRQIYEEGTTEEGEAICMDMNRTYQEALRMLGISAHLSFIDLRNPLTHVDVCFEDEEGKWYYANLTGDVMRIKTGMKLRNFGLSQEQLTKKLKKEDILIYLYRMNEENEGKEFTGVPEEQIRQWDAEDGYTYQGLYTNDVLDRLAKEMVDETFISQFFGTNKKEELVQKKFEFIMDKVEIVNIHRRKPIGDVEAIDYYRKIMERILTQEEKAYIEHHKAFIEKNGKREAKDIVVIKKEKENVYYVYNREKQIFENVAKEELITLPIKYHTTREDKLDISVLIEQTEKRWKEKDTEERE